MRLKTLSYTSLARLDLREQDLADIHQAARHLNALDGITGLLLFDGVRFLQVIEGAEEAIDNLVERLRRDQRHSAFEVRDERCVGSRAFPDWSMELVRVSNGYRDARSEVEAIMPDTIAPDLRARVLAMSDEMAQPD